MTRTISGAFWIALYLVVVLAPIGLMLVPPVPAGRSFWIELSVALGFVGLTQLAIQFVLIARFTKITAPYGIDVILQYHRSIAMLAIAAILAHPIIIVLDFPARLELLNPLAGNWASRAGLLSIAALAGIAVTSLYRERLGIGYERWRLWHLVLGVTALVAAQVHVSLAGLYTNSVWKHAVWIGTAGLMVGLVLYLRVIKPARQQAYRWQVAEIRELPGETHVIVLDPVGHRGIDFAPGQFAWIKLARSPFTLEEHPFSFASSAERPGRIEFGIKGTGDFSRRIATVEPGTRVYLDGPHGAFSIDRYPAVGFVFIGGGVGMTPLMSFLHTMADRSDPRPVLLLYAEKSPDAVTYRESLDALQGRLDLETVLVLENAPDDWEGGERGFIDAALLGRRLPEDRARRSYFVCGPPAMMDAVHDALIAEGIAESQVQLERFNLA